MGSLHDVGTLKGHLSGVGQLRGKLSIPGVVSGTTDYERLRNKPSIESVTLIGNKDFPDLGLDAISTDDLLDILN